MIRRTDQSVFLILTGQYCRLVMRSCQARSGDRATALPAGFRPGGRIAPAHNRAPPALKEDEGWKKTRSHGNYIDEDATGIPPEGDRSFVLT